MARIGEVQAPAATRDALARGRLRASLVPDLLVEARRIVNTVIAGWHGRRKRGIGENFWQFRPYVEGDASRIDWRRSARDDHTYVRDREWEAAHTVWLWADPSPSMLYKSTGAGVSKQSRALVLALAMAELLSRSGERIAWPGLTDPFTARNGAERIAAQLMHAGELPAKPDLSGIRRFCDIIIASDFLDPVEETMAWLDVLARHGVRAHLIEVADPAEETFPYAGRTEFTDPETGDKLTAGRAEMLGDEYRLLYTARRQELAAWCKRLGWSFTVNHTDRLASDALVRLHMAMTADGGYAGLTASGHAGLTASGHAGLTASGHAGLTASGHAGLNATGVHVGLTAGHAGLTAGGHAGLIAGGDHAGKVGA